MAEAGKATIGVRVDVDNPFIRQRALELAVDTRLHNSENAESIVKRAAVFAAFIEGKQDKPAVTNVFNIAACSGLDPVEVAKRVNACSI